MYVCMHRDNAANISICFKNADMSTGMHCVLNQTSGGMFRVERINSLLTDTGSV